MAANAVVRARVNQSDKEEATAVLDNIGLSMTDLIRVTVTFVARNHALPFDINVPNAETRAAIEESWALAASRKLRFASSKDLIDALDQEGAKRKTHQSSEGI